MLSDQDRIFTNIYGRFDKSLQGAMARGHWKPRVASIGGAGRDEVSNRRQFWRSAGVRIVKFAKNRFEGGKAWQM